MFEELWSEIADAPGEIFDVIEYKEEWEKEEKFNVENYLNSNYDYWSLSLLYSGQPPRPVGALSTISPKVPHGVPS